MRLYIWIRTHIENNVSFWLHFCISRCGLDGGHDRPFSNLYQVQGITAATLPKHTTHSSFHVSEMKGTRHFKSRNRNRRFRRRYQFVPIVGPIRKPPISEQSRFPVDRGTTGTPMDDTATPQEDINALDGITPVQEEEEDYISSAESEAWDAADQAAADVLINPDRVLTEECSGTDQSDGQRSSEVYTDVGKYLMKGNILAALLPLIGTVRFTHNQYQVLRSYFNFLAGSSNVGKIPSVQYLYRTLYPLLRSTLFLPLTKLWMELNCARAGAPQPFPSGAVSTSTRKSPVCYISLSAWACRDIELCKKVNELLHRHDGAEGCLQADARCEDIERSGVVRHRETHVSSASVRCFSRANHVFKVSSLLQARCTVEIGVKPQRSQSSSVLCNRGFQLRLTDRIYILAGTVGETFQCDDTDYPFRGADLCTPVNVAYPNAVEEFQQEQFYVVHRLIRDRREPAVFLTSTKKESPLYGIQLRCTSLRDTAPPFAARPEYNEERSPECSVPVSGTLRDGREYVVYRVLLYADDFEQHAGKKGSAGGLYMTPLVLPQSWKTARRGVRILGLTPPGVTTQDLIAELIPDIVRTSTDGVECVNKAGDSVVVFTDVVAFVCDYHEANHASFVRGTTALAPCNLCTFLKGSAIGVSSSDYAYTAAVHSGHGSFRRDYRRMNSVLSYSKAEDHLQRYGLKSGSDFLNNPPPLHRLHQELSKARHRVPLTENGQPVVPATFDPYLSVLVAPDHLLTGLSVDVINLNFRILSPGQRVMVEAILLHMLQSNGMRHEAHVYNHGKLCLHSMSMSSIYNLLLLSPWAFLCASHADQSGTVRTQEFRPPSRQVSLLFQLQMLVSKTQYYPQPSLDGVSRSSVLSDDENARSLKEMAEHYVREVDSLCKTCSHSKKFLDKPNIHRLLELYHHSIPAMGHVRHFQELMFETAHQPLKRALRQSNHRDAQLHAMHAIAEDEWKYRLHAALNGASTADEFSEADCRSIKRILCGSDSFNANEEIDCEQIRDSMWKPTIDYLLSQCDKSYHDGNSPLEWFPVERTTQEEDFVLPGLRIEFAADLHSCKEVLKSIHHSELISGANFCTVLMAKKECPASQSRSFSCNSTVRSVQSGDVVESIVHKSWRLQSRNGPTRTTGSDRSILLCDITSSLYKPERSDEFEKTQWKILQLMHFSGASTSKMYSYVIPIVHYEEGGFQVSNSRINMYKADRTKGVFILPLSVAATKVLSIHPCWAGQGSCHISCSTKSVHHSKDDGSNQLHFICTRAHGFPPRNA